MESGVIWIGNMDCEKEGINRFEAFDKWMWQRIEIQLDGTTD